MTAPVSYRTNADGSVTVTGFAHAVRIGPREARYQQAFGARDATGAWAGPEAVSCGNCGAEAAFQTRSEPKGPELIFLHYHCAACGARDIEPFD